MSLDFSVGISVDTGSPEGPKYFEIDSFNYTHNVVPMWKLIGIYEVLYRTEARSAYEVGQLLREGLQKMLGLMQECHALDPVNGCGDANSAAKFLEDIVKCCEEHPKAFCCSYP